MSHQKKHQLPPHARRRQKSAEETLSKDDPKLTGGVSTLDVKENNVKRAPLWTGDHGMTQKP